jgi:hypothetical protein
MLPGMSGSAGVGATAASEAPGITVAHTTPSTTVNDNTWTLTGVSYGAEPIGGATRHIVLVVTCHDDDTDDITTGVGTVTLGGETVTSIRSLSGVDEPTNSTGLIYAGIVAMPTGTSGTLVFPLSGFTGTMDRYSMAAIRVIGINSTTPTNSDYSTTYGEDIALTVPSNGFGVLAYIDIADGGGSITGTGVVSLFNNTAGAGAYRLNAGTIAHPTGADSIQLGAAFALNSA